MVLSLRIRSWQSWLSLRLRNKHPATVVQEYDIIQGRPALKSQAILARFQLAGGKVEYGTYTDDKVEMTFSTSCWWISDVMLGR
jgi:hypothetical protein